jgi:hypothetical protein
MKRIPAKLKPWFEARKRFKLSHAHTQMARELGMNPRKFGSLEPRSHGSSLYRLLREFPFCGRLGNFEDRFDFHADVFRQAAHPDCIDQARSPDC